MSDNKSEEILAEINYDITLDEEDRAFRIFQRLYVFKKNLFRSALFAVVAVMFLIQIAMGKGDNIAWGLMTVCIAFIAVIWITPIRIRKMLLVALETLKDDRYIMRIYDSGFEIETVIPQDDAEIAKAIDDADGEERDETDEETLERLTPPKSEYRFSQEGLRLVENDDMYMIFVSKETFHILPKRALDGDQKSAIEEIFHKKFEDRKVI